MEDMSETRKENLEVSFARLEEKHNSLAREVNEIKTNHLAHIASDIKGLQISQTKTNLKIAYWSGGVGVGLAILQIALSLWKK